MKAGILATGAAILSLLAAAPSALLSQVTQPAATAVGLPAEVQSQIDLAYLLANGDLYEGYLPTLLGGITNPGVPTPLAQLGQLRERIAVRAFDNLYYVGLSGVGAWALNTSDGIILFDALNNADEAENILVPGLRSLGLDPANIKYVVIMHGHGDHYGGARYLQDHYHPRILMGAADWDMVLALGTERNGRPLPPPPRRDTDVVDGQRLTLGDTSVTLYVTPGHTPATLSAIIPTSYNGQPHRVAFWGGNGMPNSLTPTASTAGLLSYREQLFRFTRIGVAANVDAIISNHPVVDGTVEKSRLMQAASRPAQNPWVVGLSTFIRFMGSNIAAMDAGIALARTRAN
jgi:metallo-beta-lactamase class B